jgi:CBS domain containing-hemolysin-like protein
MTTLFLVISVALAISFLCSILESVLLSITHSYVAVLEEREEPLGRILARMRRSIDEPIAAILTLNTISHTIGAAMGGALALQVFGDRWIALFSAVLTLAILIFSEILPKTIGATYWQTLAKPTAYTLRAMIVVMKPILIPLSAFNRMISPRGEKAPTVSRAELEVLAEIGRREGTIDEDEWQVVTNVMNLDDVKVGEVMTPRTSIVAVPIESTVESAQEVMLEEGHMRLPVYENSVDHVVGILLARDLWRAAREGVRDIREIVRTPRFVPASKPVEDLIKEMRKERIKMAIVLDEFGGTAGLVALEDLIEEIIGEIQDEHEQEPLPFEAMASGEQRIAGTVPVWEVNERFALELPEDYYDTIGGFIFGQLGRIAREHDEVRVPGGVFRVIGMDGRRIDRLAFFPDEAGGSAAEPAP